ncbi:26777_t:CDS:2, partial [Racocetra persica]
ERNRETKSVRSKAMRQETPELGSCCTLREENQNVRFGNVILTNVSTHVHVHDRVTVSLERTQDAWLSKSKNG